MKSRLCEGVAVRVCWWWSCAWKVVVECRRKMEVPFFASKLGYLWGLFVDVVHRVLKYCLCWSFVYIIMADSFVHLCWGFGVHEVICGICLLMWSRFCLWRGVCWYFFFVVVVVPYVFTWKHECCFFCCGGPDFGFCFCFVLKTFGGGCCFY